MAKTALVTGANKGIGYAIATQLIQKGYTVLVGARDAERGAAAVSDLQAFGNAELLLVDVANLDSIHEAVANINANYDGLDLLINNAGISGDMERTAWEFEAQELLDIYKVDFIGPYELTKGLLPVLQKNNGTIINVSTPIEPGKWWHPLGYMAAKAPLNVMTKDFGLEFEQQGMPVEIFAVMPGAVSTDLNGHIQGDFVRTTENAAELILSFFFDDQNHNGQVINEDGSVVNYNPQH
ncbi:SDR family NAD(P)-dependent oxidoreductase [Weissella confusa]|uniref:SDR family NAD(P)-dependent oxidoreductase n=1 Tax=Weissella confusa TaxID=1583 RepID=UPI003982E5A8